MQQPMKNRSNKAKQFISVDDRLGFYNYLNNQLELQIRQLGITAEQLSLLTESDILPHLREAR
jgi:hypothetical protein